VYCCRKLSYPVGAALGMLLLLSLVSAGPARADVTRIREMALELQQKLAAAEFESDAKVKEPNLARVYKDYDFILKQSKVEEVTDAVGTDPYADRLRMFLISSIVESQLATFVDDLREFEQTATAEIDGKEVPYSELLQQLATLPDEGERRKVASVLPPLVETSAVFRKDIARRRAELYQGWGYANFAEFYEQREQLDLDAVNEQATAFLDSTAKMYDTLLEEMSMRILGVEARKVRFADLPYLVQGTEWEGIFPTNERIRRFKGLFRGLGIDLGDNPAIDNTPRPGKILRARAYGVMVPNDVRVSTNPAGGVRDGNRAVYAVGEAMIYSLSTQTAFEAAYLVNEPAQEAMAWFPRFVLDEPGWIKANAQGKEFEFPAYLRFRAFQSLFEARFLAALTKFEILVYRGTDDPFKEFRSLMKEATGARLATNDAAQALEYLTDLRSVSRFQGLLVASAGREALRASQGENWYADGKMGPTLLGLWAQGGTLTPEAVQAAVPGEGSPAAFLAGIQRLLTTQ